MDWISKNWIQLIVEIIQAIISGVFVGLVIFWLDDRRAKRERRLSDYRIALGWEYSKPKAQIRYFDLAKTNLSGHNFAKANMEGTIIYDCGIWGANFNEANLRHADFRKSRIVSTDFIKTYAYKTDFSGATIKPSPNSEHHSPTNFTDTVLKQAKFIKAHLSNAIFVGADLSGTDFSKAIVVNCDFSNSTLTDSKWKKVKRVENCVWKNVKGISPDNFPSDLWKEIQRQNTI